MKLTYCQPTGRDYPFIALTAVQDRSPVYGSTGWDCSTSAGSCVMNRGGPDDKAHFNNQKRAPALLLPAGHPLLDKRVER